MQICGIVIKFAKNIQEVSSINSKSMKTMLKLMLLLMLLSYAGAQAEPMAGMPLVREGARWVHTEYYECSYPYIELGEPTVTAGRLYCYLLRGDTVIESETYKKCYRISMSRQQLWDTVGLPCSTAVPAACLRQDGRKVYCRFEGKPEFKLYDFDGPIVVEGYSGESTPSQMSIEGYSCAVFSDKDHLFIEGIGSVSSETGDLLYPYLPFATGMKFTKHGLSHVEDAGGKLIYMAANYGLYGDETGLRGDVNHDNVVDIDDLSICIDQLFICSSQVDEAFYEGDTTWRGWTFLRAADVNSDRVVDIDDVNAVINRILAK